MKTKTPSPIRDELPPEGRELLRLLVSVIKNQHFRLHDPTTYVGYQKCCEQLGLITPGMDVPWGRLLQLNGLNHLNEWTIRFGLPAVTGLIVNVSGDRAWYPGGDYFKSHGRADPDFDWWKDQIAKAAKFNWQPYL
jgi:hypothetical protein